MTETEQLLLEGMKDIRGEIRSFNQEMTRDIGEMKETQARMDERLKSLEKNASEDECLKKRMQALESSQDLAKPAGGRAKSTAITISLAGVGAAVLWVIKALSGSP